MNIRQILLDVDKAIERPSVIEIAGAIEDVSGVDGVSIIVTEIDMETVGMEVTIEGENLKYDELVNAIEKAGAVVHGVNQVSSGKKTVTPVRRVR